MLSAPRIKGDESAYVPYLFARSMIARIAEDMQKMRDSHVSVIHQIEMNYKCIEDETQVS